MYTEKLKPQQGISIITAASTEGYRFKSSFSVAIRPLSLGHRLFCERYIILQDRSAFRFFLRPQGRSRVTIWPLKQNYGTLFGTVFPKRNSLGTNAEENARKISPVTFILEKVV